MAEEVEEAKKVTWTLSMMETVVDHLGTQTRSTNAYSGQSSKITADADLEYYKTQVGKNMAVKSYSYLHD